MKLFILYLFTFLPALAIAQTKKPSLLFSFGIDFRQESIDIEDASDGPNTPIASSTFGDLTDFYGFWQVLSIHARLGIETKKKWQYSVVCNARYNHNHYLQDPWVRTGWDEGYFDESTPVKKKIKLDIFLDVEKKIRLKKKQEKYLTILAGVGFTNINSYTNVTYRDNYTSDIIKYTGTYLDFGPKLSIGYQYKRIKGSLDGYIIEGHDKSNLTAVWVGATVSYEIRLKKKKHNNITGK